MEGAKPQRRYDEPKPHETLLYAYMGQCTPCGKAINGTLYACRLCPGTEWCEACSRTTDHPIDHPFLRIQLQSDLIAEGHLDLDIEGDDAKQLWQTCVDRSPLKDAGEAVPFLTFIDQLSKFLQEDLTQGEVVALEAIFGDISRDDAISFNSLEIQRIEYALFIKRFGPIRLSLKKVQQVLIDGQVWFHGNMDLRKSQSLFLGKPDTSFMIRYSSRTPGAFSINYMRGGQMKIFNRIANNVEGEGIHVYQSDKEKLQYSSFASFIRSNSKLFAIPVDDPLASFLKIKKQQIKDMGVNSNIPFTFNHVSTTASSVTPDDFYDALARKVNGFSSQMSISPPNTAPTSREKAPIRKSRSSNSSPNKRGIAMSSGSNMKRKPKREEQESSESRALRALLLEQDKSKKERQYRPGSHYSNFFSDDEEEDLPNIVADM